MSDNRITQASVFVSEIDTPVYGLAQQSPAHQILLAYLREDYGHPGILADCQPFFPGDIGVRDNRLQNLPGQRAVVGLPIAQATGSLMAAAIGSRTIALWLMAFPAQSPAQGRQDIRPQGKVCLLGQFRANSANQIRFYLSQS